MDNPKEIIVGIITAAISFLAVLLAFVIYSIPIAIAILMVVWILS